MEDQHAPAGGTLVVVATLVGIASVIGIWVVAALVWPHLPDRIPVHFGASGTPDRYADKTAGNWYALPALATAMSVMFFGLERLVMFLIRRHPGAVNVPRKEQFMALPDDARVRAFAPLIALMRGSAAPVCWVFTFILWSSYAAASGAPLSGLVFALGTFGNVAIAIAWLTYCCVAIWRNVRRETDAAAAG